MAISNDKEFKSALAGLYPAQQRQVATVADGAGTDNCEAEAQYRTLEAFLNS